MNDETSAATENDPVEAKRQKLKGALTSRLAEETGMLLMDRWNAGHIDPTEMAVIGHREGADYKFTLGHRGHEFKVTVSW